MELNNRSSSITTIARLGLVSKGVVYILIGMLAFMAAFELGGQSNKNAGKAGAFNFIHELPAGKVLLVIMAIGLLCYAIWRVVQAVTAKKQEHKASKRIVKQLRYAFSGFAYLGLAFLAAKMVFTNKSSEGNSNQDVIAQIMQKPYGTVLLIMAGTAIGAIGIYQLWYAFSEKYKKHISTGAINSKASNILLSAGKLGYAARGIVWIIIGWLLIKATLRHSAAEAGDTAKAFQFLEEASYGSYLLGTLGFGLVCYGAFNFLQARFGKFD